MIKDQLIELQNQIQTVKDKYAEDKKAAHWIHKDIVSQEKEELEPLESRMDQLKDRFMDSHEATDDQVFYRSSKSLEVDADQLPEQYIKHVPDMEKLKEEMYKSEWTKPIPGVKVVEKRSVVVKKQG